jgi:hypothetical protein
MAGLEPCRFIIYRCEVSVERAHRHRWEGLMAASTQMGNCSTLALIRADVDLRDVGYEADHDAITKFVWIIPNGYLKK